MVPTMGDPTAERPRPGGVWFEDLRVGQVFVSPARTVTEADIGLFAGLSGDFNPLHVDEVHARRTPFRGRIAHGLLVQSIASGLAAQTRMFEGTIAALAGMDMRFEAPVRAGTTIHVRLEVLEVDPSPARSRGSVRFRTQVFDQDGARVLDGHWDTLMMRDRNRRAGPEAAG
jgi:acyl dehydratase